MLFALSVVCGTPVRVPPVLLLSFKNVLSILERARKIIEAVPSPTAPLTQWRHGPNGPWHRCRRRACRCPHHHRVQVSRSWRRSHKRCQTSGPDVHHHHHHHRRWPHRHRVQVSSSSTRSHRRCQTSAPGGGRLRICRRWASIASTARPCARWSTWRAWPGPMPYRLASGVSWPSGLPGSRRSGPASAAFLGKARRAWRSAWSTRNGGTCGSSGRT